MREEEIILFPSPLDLQSFNKAFEEVFPYIDYGMYPPKKLILNLEGVEYYHIERMLDLLVLLRIMQKNLLNTQIEIRFSKNEGVLSKLQNFDLFENIPSEVILIPSKSKLRNSNSEDSIVPIQFLTARYDIVEATKGIYERLQNLLTKKFADIENRIKKICSIISEMSNNIPDHAESNGFIVGTIDSRSRRVRIAVSDFGVGIRKTLSEKYGTQNESEWTDRSAIKKALEYHVTSKEGRRGVGLSEMFSILRDWKGKLQIRSYSGLVKYDFSKKNGSEVEINNPTEEWDTAPFPGTHLFISIPYGQKTQQGKLFA